MTPDTELLRRYVAFRDEQAFAEIVRRYIGMVYSTALRRVANDSGLAQDVTQEVLTDLATKAATLSPQVLLGGWLYTSTRFAAAKAARAEQRRRNRELASDMHNSTQGPTDEQWQKIGPLLEDAMADLAPNDRDAIVMRFFLSRTFDQIARELTIKEDAARARVVRALDKLNTALRRRGIQSTAEALGIVLTAHTLVATPPNLTATVTAAALHALGDTAVTAVPSTLLAPMAASKTLLSVTAVAVAAVSVLSFLLWRRSQELQDLRGKLVIQISHADERARLEKRNRQLEATLLALESAQHDRETGAAAAARRTEELESELGKWLDKVDRLKRFASIHPEWVIPEMSHLNAVDWLDATKLPNLESEADYREALSTLRRVAKDAVGSKIARALDAYLKANGGTPPRDARELAPYFTDPIDPAILARYTTNPSGEVKGLRGGQKFFVVESEPVDPLWDSSMFFGNGGSGRRVIGDGPTRQKVAAAVQKYRETTGRAPETAAQLSGYFDETVDRKNVESLLQALLAKPQLPPPAPQ